MNRLWVRLTIAFGAIVASGVIVAAMLANIQIDTQFRQFVMHGQMSTQLEPRLVEYYVKNGSWVGVEAIFDQRPGSGFGMRGRGAGYGGPTFTLADSAGHIVYSQAPRSEQLSPQERGAALLLDWQGRTVGYLLTSSPAQTRLSEADQIFMGQVNRALLQAGLVAGGIGLMMGAVIARGLSAPLNRLARAARHIAQGKFDQPVPVQGANEIADLAKAFNEMALHLQQAEVLRRNLVADVAHELRTPLTVIQGNLKAILDDIYPLEKAEISNIYDETLILNRLINDLRELAQAEAGQLSLNLQTADLGAVLQDTVDLFQELASEKNIALKLSGETNLPPVLIDPDRTQQVVHNLLSNALRYTPQVGQIEVTVKQQAKLQYQANPTHIQVKVTDTGSGIAAQDLPHVFDRFWRSNQAQTQEHRGSGLGLAIARQIVQAQGGHIGVESEGLPGRGSCFWFTVPIA